MNKQAITVGSLVEISRGRSYINNQWITRIDRPEDIDVSTNSITNCGFNNVDYNAHREHWKVRLPDTSSNALSQHILPDKMLGLVVGTLFVKFCMMVGCRTDREHWKVLIGEHIYLLTSHQLQLLEKQ